MSISKKLFLEIFIDFYSFQNEVAKTKPKDVTLKKELNQLKLNWKIQSEIKRWRIKL